MKTRLGWKTITGAILLGAVQIAQAQGWIDSHTAQTISGVVIAWTGYAVRDAIAKSGPAQ